MGQTENYTGQTGTGQPDFHEASRQYWLEYEGLSSESYFRQRLDALVNDSWNAYNSGDVERVERNLARVSWVEPLVQSEPLVSFYETGLVLAILPLAYWAASNNDLETGFKLAGRCREVLIGKRNRRREMGLSYRPDSEAWFKLYTVLAILKWRGGQEYRNTVISPENLVCDYLKIERRCMNYLDGQPVSKKDMVKHITLGLEWCGVQVIKMALRWCPQHVTVLIDDFNRTHGNLLNSQAGHFMDATPTDPRNPIYWDFELFKWCVFGPATPDEAALCNQWRLDSARSSYDFVKDFSGFFEDKAKELEYLLSPQSAARVQLPAN